VIRYAYTARINLLQSNTLAIYALSFRILSLILGPISSDNFVLIHHDRWQHKDLIGDCHYWHWILIGSRTHHGSATFGHDDTWEKNCFKILRIVIWLVIAILDTAIRLVVRSSDPWLWRLQSWWQALWPDRSIRRYEWQLGRSWWWSRCICSWCFAKISPEQTSTATRR